MNQTKKKKLSNLLASLESKKEPDILSSIKSVLSDIKQPKDYSDKFLKLERVVLSKKFDRIDFSSVLRRIDEVVSKIEGIRIPEVDVSSLVSSVDRLSIEVSKIPRYVPIDYSKNIDGIKLFVEAYFGVIVEELRKLRDKKDEKVYSEIELLKKSNRGGGSMYQAWQEDTTANGSLSGTIDGINGTFTLKYPAINSVVFMFRNGVLESLADYSVGVDRRTIIYSANIPQISDILQSKYPR